MDISVSLTNVRGEQYGVPKLVLDLAVESQTDVQLAIISVTAEIRVTHGEGIPDVSKSHYIGTGFLESGTGQLVSRNSKTNWRIGVPLSPYQLKKVEGVRKGTDLFLQVRFFCTAGKRVSLPPQTIADITRPAVGGGVYSSDDCIFKVAQSDWVKTLGELGYGDYFLVEIPLKGVPERRGMQKSLEHLKAAWEHFEQGNDDETLGSCYKAFEYLAKKNKCAHPDKNAFEKILTAIPEEAKRTRLRELMHELCQFLSLGRHEPGTEKVILDEKESEYALVLSQATLGYLAKLMRETTTK